MGYEALFFTNTEDFGVLSNLVKCVGWLICASLTISLAWRGRTKWEPSEVDVPNSPQKVAGLLTAVSLALLWVFMAQPSYSKTLTQISIGLVFSCLISFFLYSFLVSLKTFRVGTKRNQRNIIGGFILTNHTKSSLKKRTNLTIQEILEKNNFDPDKIWSRGSRSAAKLTFLICYILFVVCGSLALTCVGILFLLKIENSKVAIPKEKTLIYIAIILNGEVGYTREITQSFRGKFDEMVEPTCYKAHYEEAIGFAEINSDSQNEEVFKSVFERFPDRKPDYLVTIGTEVSKYAYSHYLNKIPILFIGVTDPQFLGLVNSLEPDSNRGNIAGGVFYPSLELYVNFLSKSFPGKTFGFIYNPQLYRQDEQFLKQLQAKIKEMKADLKVVPIQTNKVALDPNQINQADVFFGTYFVARNAVPLISSINKPFILPSKYGVQKNALLSIAADNYQIGVDTAKEILFPAVVGGKSFSEMPILVPKKIVIGVNRKIARKFGITIPEVVIKEADLVIG